MPPSYFAPDKSLQVALPAHKPTLEDLVIPPGDRLVDLSQRQPIVMIFLRHRGCTFCRETLAHLSRHQDEFWRRGWRPIIVHMGPESTSEEIKDTYKLPGIKVISDPELKFYQAFGLKRGSLKQLFGPQVVVRAVSALLRGHGIGRLEGDGFMMSGMYLLVKGQSHLIHEPRDAGDIGDIKQILSHAEAWI